MSKAYNRVEWNFLEKLTENLGFDEKWVSLISMCIRSVSFSALVNGEPHGLFQPNRGLWKGDPLSPYLFLLHAEGLHSLIQQVENNGLIRGVSLCKDGPKVLLNWARVWLELPQAQVKSKFSLVDQILFVIGNLFVSADFNIYIYIYCIKCSHVPWD